MGIEPIPPRSAQDLQLDRSVGGLVVAGSYVPKTTEQLEVLRHRSGDRLTTVVLDVNDLLRSPQSRDKTIEEAVRLAEKEIAGKQDVLVMTSRELVRGKDERESLDIGSTVAEALVSFLQNLRTRPRYLIAKVSVCVCVCFGSWFPFSLFTGFPLSKERGTY